MTAMLDRLGIGPAGGPVWARLGVAAAGLIVGGVFLLAAWPKLLDPGAFALSVFRYQVLPDAAINLVALILPWLELICATALLAAPRWRVAAGTLIIGMLAVFTVLLISTITRGISISCGCFSVDAEAATIGWSNVIRNVVLVALTCLLVWSQCAGQRDAAPADGIGDDTAPG